MLEKVDYIHEQMEMEYNMEQKIKTIRKFHGSKYGTNGIKDGLKTMREEFKQLRCFLTQNFPSREEDKGNEVVESHSYKNKFLTSLENKSSTQSSLQDTLHYGFSLGP